MCTVQELKIQVYELLDTLESPSANHHQGKFMLYVNKKEIERECEGKSQ